MFISRRKNRPGEDLSANPAGEAAGIASCTSTVVDRSGDSETQDVAVSPTSVDVERLCATSSCTPASFDEPTVDLHLAADEVRPLTDDADDDDYDDGTTASVWIETTAPPRSPMQSSPSSIVWRSREFQEVGPRISPPDRRRTSDGSTGKKKRWLPRSPAVELGWTADESQTAEVPDPAANRGDVVNRRRVSGTRLPNGIAPGMRSSSPPPYQSGWTHLRPGTLARPRSESNFAAAVSAAPVAQRSNPVERLRSFPWRSPAGDADSSAGGRRRRRTVDLAPAAAASSPYVVSVDDVNRSKLGRVTKEELYRMWKTSERSLHAQLRVAMQQKAELLQRLQAAGLSSAERLTVT